MRVRNPVISGDPCLESPRQFMSTTAVSHISLLFPCFPLPLPFLSFHSQLSAKSCPRSLPFFRLPFLQVFVTRSNSSRP